MSTNKSQKHNANSFLAFAYNLLSLLVLDDGLHGRWIDSGQYSGDRVVNFAGTRALKVHLGQLSTTGNFVNGAPSTLLATVAVARYVNVGDTISDYHAQIRAARVQATYTREYFRVEDFDS